MSYKPKGVIMTVKLTIAATVSLSISLFAATNLFLGFYLFGSPLSEPHSTTMCVYTERLIYSYAAIFFAVLSFGIFSLK